MYNNRSYLPDYYKHRIAVVGDEYYFKEYRDALSCCINRYGFDAQPYSTIKEALEQNPTCVIIINPTEYRVPPKRKDILWVMVQTEQLFGTVGNNQLFFNRNLKRIKPYLSHFDLILDSCNNVDKLKAICKADVRFFSMGSFKNDKSGKESFQSEKEYDLIFLGDSSGIFNRRKELLNYLKGKYTLYPSTSNLWGEERDKAISKCKIGLNIHFEESRCADSYRFQYYIDNKCMILSEPIDRPYPFQANEDYVEFIYTDICEKIDYYLKNEEERNQIIDHAYNTFYNHTLYDATKVFVDWLILKSYSDYIDIKMSYIKKIKYYYRLNKEFKNKPKLE